MSSSNFVPPGAPRAPGSTTGAEPPGTPDPRQLPIHESPVIGAMLPPPPPGLANSVVAPPSTPRLHELAEGDPVSLLLTPATTRPASAASSQRGPGSLNSLSRPGKTGAGAVPAHLQTPLQFASLPSLSPLWTKGLATPVMCLPSPSLWHVGADADAAETLAFNLGAPATPTAAAGERKASSLFSPERDKPSSRAAALSPQKLSLGSAGDHDEDPPPSPASTIFHSLQSLSRAGSGAVSSAGGRPGAGDPSRTPGIAGPRADGSGVGSGRRNETRGGAPVSPLLRAVDPSGSGSSAAGDEDLHGLGQVALQVRSGSANVMLPLATPPFSAAPAPYLPPDQLLTPALPSHHRRHPSASGLSSAAGSPGVSASGSLAVSLLVGGGATLVPPTTGTALNLSCHHCRQRRDPAHLIHCAQFFHTSQTRCGNKYCRFCLTKYYPDLLARVGAGASDPSQKLVPMVRGESIDWIGPACLGRCLCSTCRTHNSASAGRRGDDSGAPLHPVPRIAAVPGFDPHSMSPAEALACALVYFEPMLHRNLAGQGAGSVLAEPEIAHTLVGLAVAPGGSASSSLSSSSSASSLASSAALDANGFLAAQQQQSRLSASSSQSTLGGFWASSPSLPPKCSPSLNPASSASSPKLLGVARGAGGSGAAPILDPDIPEILTLGEQRVVELDLSRLASVTRALPAAPPQPAPPGGAEPVSRKRKATTNTPAASAPASATAAGSGSGSGSGPGAGSASGSSGSAAAAPEAAVTKKRKTAGAGAAAANPATGSSGAAAAAGRPAAGSGAGGQAQGHSGTSQASAAASQPRSTPASAPPPPKAPDSPLPTVYPGWPNPPVYAKHPVAPIPGRPETYPPPPAPPSTYTESQVAQYHAVYQHHYEKALREQQEKIRLQMEQQQRLKQQQLQQQRKQQRAQAKHQQQQQQLQQQQQQQLQQQQQQQPQQLQQQQPPQSQPQQQQMPQQPPQQPQPQQQQYQQQPQQQQKAAPPIPMQAQVQPQAQPPPQQQLRPVGSHPQSGVAMQQQSRGQISSYAQPQQMLPQQQQSVQQQLQPIHRQYQPPQQQYQQSNYGAHSYLPQPHPQQQQQPQYQQQLTPLPQQPTMQQHLQSQQSSRYLPPPQQVQAPGAQLLRPHPLQQQVSPSSMLTPQASASSIPPPPQQLGLLSRPSLMSQNVSPSAALAPVEQSFSLQYAIHGFGSAAAAALQPTAQGSGLGIARM